MTMGLEGIMVSWELWAADSFDREAAPMMDAKGKGLAAGLELLWKKFVNEGVLDDGRATFTDFSLHWGGSRAEITVKLMGRDQLEPGAARLRAWVKADAGLLLKSLASTHRRLIDARQPGNAQMGQMGQMGHAEAVRVLELAAQCNDPEELRRRLPAL